MFYVIFNKFHKNQEIFKKALENVMANDYNIIARSGTPTEQNDNREVNKMNKFITGSISLWNLFRDASDEIATELKWRIYDTTKHGKLITDDYGRLPGTVMTELDDDEIEAIMTWCVATITTSVYKEPYPVFTEVDY